MASSRSRRNVLSNSTTRHIKLLLSVIVLTSFTLSNASALPSFNSTSTNPIQNQELISHPVALFRSQTSHSPYPTRITQPLDKYNSLDSQAQRQALTELKDFTHELFILRFNNEFFIQMAVAAACLAVLIIIGGE